MLKRSTAIAVTTALTSLLVLASGSYAAASLSSDNGNNNLRGRPVGEALIDHEESSHDDNSAPSSTFGRILENTLSTSNEDIDAQYPAKAKDGYHSNDVLFSFSSTLTAPNSNVMRQPPPRNLAETAHAEEASHGEGEGGHGGEDSMVVHVTYEQIYAILVFLMTATALGIVTSKLGMVSDILYNACFVPFLQSVHSHRYYMHEHILARSCRRNHHRILARTAFSRLRTLS